MNFVGKMARRLTAQRFMALVLCGFLAASLSACATRPANSQAAMASTEIKDPIEPVNRAVFKFNDVLDIVLIEPAAKVYKAVLPGFVRDGVRNFVRNLDSPIVVANELLQGNFGGAGVSTARFVINTTAGIGGLVDVASAQGLTYRDADFGQTMGKWGVGNGCYLVLPVIGPSSLRDGAGLAADTYASPVRIISRNTDNDWFYYSTTVAGAIDTRSRLIKAVDDLRKNSLDYYAAVRSAYSQKRRAMIEGDGTGAGNGAADMADIPDYDAQ
ncbi:MAG: VacJ family lipoprotein [Alphaproteobacteria bacterium]|nr:VacJ family lipoprotein [Alphaproteobacteria bacterium]